MDTRVLPLFVCDELWKFMVGVRVVEANTLIGACLLFGSECQSQAHLSVPTAVDVVDIWALAKETVDCRA